MPYSPKYAISSKILSYVGAIDVAREVITSSPLIPAWERRFQKEARAKIIHHGTHLEGNDLNMEEVEQILDPADPSLESKLLNQNSPTPVGRDRDVQEVINYRTVMDYIDAMEQSAKNAPIKVTEAMLLQIHELTVAGLLPSVEAGKYRSVKVVIRNTQTREITFRPPSPIEIPFAMNEFFTWLSSPAGHATHPLLRAGLLHYELVRIHPFTDGNGRASRAMALLLLFLEGYEVKKFFSLEEYYDAHPQQYYDALKSVTDHDGDMTAWLEYFLEGIAVEFTRIKNLVQKLSLDLHLKSTLGGHQLTLSERQIKLVEYLERYGEVSMKNARDLLPDISDDTVLRDLRDLVEKKLLTKRGTTKGTKYYLKN